MNNRQRFIKAICTPLGSTRLVGVSLVTLCLVLIPSLSTQAASLNSGVGEEDLELIQPEALQPFFSGLKIDPQDPEDLDSDEEEKFAEKPSDVSSLTASEDDLAAILDNIITHRITHQNQPLAVYYEPPPPPPRDIPEPSGVVAILGIGLALFARQQGRKLGR